MALLHSYGIATPYMVDRTAPSSAMISANQVLAKVEDGGQFAGAWIAENFGFWCNAIGRSYPLDKSEGGVPHFI